MLLSSYDSLTFLFSESRLFDNVSTLKNENLQLTLLNERIKFSNTESVLSSGGWSFGFLNIIYSTVKLYILNIIS